MLVTVPIYYTERTIALPTYVHVPSNKMLLAAKKPPTGITIIPRENIIRTPYVFIFNSLCLSLSGAIESTKPAVCVSSLDK